MPDKYAVIGNPVGHSLSPDIHQAFARATGHDIVYERILAPLDGFVAAVRKFQDEGGKGLNVTLPFKHEAWNFVQERVGFAGDAEAVNTIAFKPGTIVGHNTDGVGLTRDIKDNLGCAIRGKRVLLMGAGGAAYGVMESLLREQPERLVVANRTLEKAMALVGHFEKRLGSPFRGLSGGAYEGLRDSGFDLVINATSAGLSGVMPPLPERVFAPGALAYDMVYGKMTPFLEFAAAQGTRTANGIGMLVEQAAVSFLIWRGVRPSTAPVIALLRARVSSKQ
jgi:shikimate dehydrogenase